MIVIYLASEVDYNSLFWEHSYRLNILLLKLAAKDINCDLCFPYLTKIQPMNYYSQVEEPLNAVERVAEKTGDIIWHIPKISEMGSLEAEMELPCQKGEIHAFSFNDRNLLAHGRLNI